MTDSVILTKEIDAFAIIEHDAHSENYISWLKRNGDL